MVRNSRRFQTWGLCELLLQRSWDLRFDNPRTGAELAQLGLFVAEALDPDSYEPALLEDLKGRAWGYLGNNRRILSDFRGAREALVESAECLGRGTGDPCERAQLLFVEAALDRSHGCFPEAIQKFDRALAIYRKFSGESDIACILIEKGHTYLRAGKAVVARSCFLDALDLLDPEEDLHFVLAAEHNLVLCLTEVGDHEEAWRRLPRLRELHLELSDQLNRIRLRWLEAKVLLGLERVHEAEAGFLEVRAAFIEEGVAYDVALVSLDLAAIYARCGRFSELRSTAAEALEIVRSRSVHRDAIAAMILFAEAAKLEQVTLGLIREMTSAVTEARTQEQSLRSR